MSERTHIEGRPTADWVYGILGQALQQAKALHISYRQMATGMMAVLAEWEKRDADDPTGIDLDVLLEEARAVRKAESGG